MVLHEPEALQLGAGSRTLAVEVDVVRMGHVHAAGVVEAYCQHVVRLAFHAMDC